MSSAARQRWRPPLWVAILGAIASLFVGAGIAIWIGAAREGNVRTWLGEFVRSPGAAGLAAVIAAVIAFVGISNQVRVSRQLLEHQRLAAAADKWWGRFEWFSDRAFPPDTRQQPFPDAVAVSILERLADTATDDVQGSAWKGMLDELRTRMADTEESPGAVDPSAPSSRPSGVARDRSGGKARAYEAEVLSALSGLRGMGINVTPATKSGDTGFDATVDLKGRRVDIEVKYAGRPEAARAAVGIARLLRNHMAHGSVPLVMAMPIDVPLPLANDGTVSVVKWNGPNDTLALAAAIERAATVPG
ncbi:MAG: hypothetical protein PHU75_00800 [Candidatus Nanopelagicales bacterium]|nr:hypothetical protein [Candidatus Nanopelagicales bacterium]